MYTNMCYIHAATQRPAYKALRSELLSQASLPNSQRLEYVLPSVPHTGSNLAGQTSGQRSIR